MKTLFDSDALFALYVPSDANHKKAVNIYSRLEKNSTKFYVSNLVIQETATVLSYKINHQVAKDFYLAVKQLELMYLDLSPDSQQSAWDIFLSQTKKGTSFVDCANVAISREYGLETIFSFDQFYQTQGTALAK